MKRLNHNPKKLKQFSAADVLNIINDLVNEAFQDKNPAAGFYAQFVAGIYARLLLAERGLDKFGKEIENGQA